MKSAALRTVVALTVLSAALPALAGAYAITDPNAAPVASGPSISLPQIPAGTFNLNWDNFLNALPFQGFVNSLQGIGSGNSVIPSPTTFTSAPAGNPNVFGSIDAWTSEHLGFQISGLIMAALGILVWVLGLVKSIVEWLIGLLR